MNADRESVAGSGLDEAGREPSLKDTRDTVIPVARTKPSGAPHLPPPQGPPPCGGPPGGGPPPGRPPAGPPGSFSSHRELAHPPPAGCPGGHDGGHADQGRDHPGTGGNCPSPGNTHHSDHVSSHKPTENRDTSHCDDPADSP